METNSTADESMPAMPDDDIRASPMEPEGENRADEGGVEVAANVEAEKDSLTELAQRALLARLPMADEERATALLKDALLAGKAGLGTAIETLPKLPWIVGVRAVEGAWPKMKATAKTQLVKGLTEDESDAARRVRLSLARALFKQDVPFAMKIAIGVAKEIRDKTTGALSQKNAQLFANVFIGKAKPWITQLSLAEVKPADADLLVHCALLAAFLLPHPPVVQLAILKWAADRLGKLHRLTAEAVSKNVARWSGKWQTALRDELPELPEEIAGVFKLPGGKSPGADSKREVTETMPISSEAVTQEGGPVAESVQGREQIKERPIYEPRPQKPFPSRESSSNRREAVPARKERPVYQPRNATGNAQNFNFGETLRQIDAHVQWLRAELNDAQAKLRQRDEEGRGKRAADRGTTLIEGQPTVEELARLNQQLEERSAELQRRIDDLLADAEDRAASIGAHSEEQVVDVDTRLRTLLGLKLQSNFSDFVALEKESPSVVVQQHYKSLLRQVFEILRHERVPLEE